MLSIELREYFRVDKGDAVEFFIDEKIKYLMFRRLNACFVH